MCVFLHNVLLISQDIVAYYISSQGPGHYLDAWDSFCWLWMVWLLQQCESRADFKWEHKSSFFNTVMLPCGNLSVFLSSVFKRAVHDSQMNKNVISFPKKMTRRTSFQRMYFFFLWIALHLHIPFVLWVGTELWAEGSTISRHGMGGEQTAWDPWVNTRESVWPVNCLAKCDIFKLSYCENKLILLMI